MAFSGAKCGSSEQEDGNFGGGRPSGDSLQWYQPVCPLLLDPAVCCMKAICVSGAWSPDSIGWPLTLEISSDSTTLHAERHRGPQWLAETPASSSPILCGLLMLVLSIPRLMGGIGACDHLLPPRAPRLLPHQEPWVVVLVASSCLFVYLFLSC